MREYYKGMSSSTPVELIAVCGFPHAGKDTFVDALLAELGQGAVRVDDGMPLRRVASLLFEIPIEDCLTQEGKLKLIETPNGQETVRKAIGDVGKCLETRYGKDCTPFLAMKEVTRLKAGNPSLSHFIFSSVRMEQPWYYRERGAVVIEIDRPGNPPSPHDFDQYDKNSVNIRVINSGTLNDLKAIARFVAALIQDTNLIRDLLDAGASVNFAPEHI